MMVNLAAGTHRVMRGSRFVALLTSTGDGLVEFLSRPHGDALIELLVLRTQEQRHEPFVVIDIWQGLLLVAGAWQVHLPDREVEAHGGECGVFEVGTSATCAVSTSPGLPAASDTFLHSGLVHASGFLMRPDGASSQPDVSVALSSEASESPSVTAQPTAEPHPETSTSVFDDPQVALDSLGRGAVQSSPSMPEEAPPSTTPVSNTNRDVEGPIPTATLETGPVGFREPGPQDVPSHETSTTPAPAFREPPRPGTASAPPDPEVRRAGPTGPDEAGGDETHAGAPATDNLGPAAVVDFGPAGIVPIRGTVIVGRNPSRGVISDAEQHVVLSDSEVSRVHARLWVDGTELFVQDLGSSNGTVLRRVIGSNHDVPEDPGSLNVLVGDSIELGGIRARFTGWNLNA